MSLLWNLSQTVECKRAQTKEGSAERCLLLHLFYTTNFTSGVSFVAGSLQGNPESNSAAYFEEQVLEDGAPRSDTKAPPSSREHRRISRTMPDTLLPRTALHAATPGEGK